MCRTGSLKFSSWDDEADFATVKQLHTAKENKKIKSSQDSSVGSILLGTGEVPGSNPGKGENY